AVIGSTPCPTPVSTCARQPSGAIRAQFGRSGGLAGRPTRAPAGRCPAGARTCGGLLAGDYDDAGDASSDPPAASSDGSADSSPDADGTVGAWVTSAQPMIV